MMLLAFGVVEVGESEHVGEFVAHGADSFRMGFAGVGFFVEDHAAFVGAGIVVEPHSVEGELLAADALHVAGVRPHGVAFAAGCFAESGIEYVDVVDVAVQIAVVFF